MGDKRINAMSRALAGAADRRWVLRALASAVIGAGVRGGMPGEADAASRPCRSKGQKCLRNGQCCSGDCETARSIPRGRRNRCGCGELVACGSRCADLATDMANCGACGTTCSAIGEVCLSGVCTCPNGGTVCADACVDTDTDETHCGSCNAPCADGWTCTSGQCTCGGQTACGPDQICCGDACVDPATSAQHCGGCDRPVPTGGQCILGKSYDGCPLLTPPGPCAPNYACLLDVDGNMSYYGYTNAGAFGCANPGGAACPSGFVCGLVYNQSFNAGQWIFRSGSAYGQCLDLSVPCTPPPQ